MQCMIYNTHDLPAMMRMHDFKLQPLLKIVVSTICILISQLLWYTNVRLKLCISRETLNGENWFVDSSIHAKVRYYCINIMWLFTINIHVESINIRLPIHILVSPPSHLQVATYLSREITHNKVILQSHEHLKLQLGEH